MKTKSTIAPEKFKIGDRKGNLIEVAFFDDVKEIQEEESTQYEYSVYTIKTIYREDLESYINGNYEDYLALAKETDYQLEASKVREKRNELLADSDKFLLLDRLGISLPSEITATTLLSSIKDFFDNLKEVLNGDWAEYRQKLRDLTKQEGFPYNVEFPEKPEE
ncbi:phage tail assembly chaperone [Bacteroides sp. 41_26]|uniref:phage tail assembly chaperone n=1 Tax=Bacteroides sp. 41_26 TaxID=1896973 RepID=UPI00259C8688|nr:phage tail assembly chaperone [Bacteroides sp. 41_26]